MPRYFDWIPDLPRLSGVVRNDEKMPIRTFCKTINFDGCEKIRYPVCRHSGERRNPVIFKHSGFNSDIVCPGHGLEAARPKEMNR
jgi:hypothetical protein